MRTHKSSARVIALLVITVLAALGTYSESNAATATANATATVVTPIAISKNLDMLFGKFIAGTGGSVVLGTAGSRAATGGVTLFTQGSTQNAASFAVSGAENSTYAITLPASSVSLSDGAAHTMTVGSFVSNPSGTGILTAGAQTLLVGGTLTVSSAQAPGNYTGSFSVSVDYN